MLKKMQAFYLYIHVRYGNFISLLTTSPFALIKYILSDI